MNWQRSIWSLLLRRRTIHQQQVKFKGGEILILLLFSAAGASLKHLRKTKCDQFSTFWERKRTTHTYWCNPATQNDILTKDNHATDTFTLRAKTCHYFDFYWGFNFLFGLYLTQKENELNWNKYTQIKWHVVNIYILLIEFRVTNLPDTQWGFVIHCRELDVS